MPATTLIDWDSNLSVNVAEIDAQHQNLVHMIDEICDIMSKNKPTIVISDIIYSDDVILTIIESNTLKII